MKQKYRPWVAAALSVVYPGLGHLYLRAWVRAVGWFVLGILTVWWLVQTGAIPQSTVTAFEHGGASAVLTASRNLPSDAVLPLFVLRVFNVVDAFLVGRRQGAQRRARERAAAMRGGDDAAPNTERSENREAETGTGAGTGAGTARSRTGRVASGLGLGSGGSEGGTCPACGRELDPELDFCPWCTTRLDGGDGESATSR